MELGTNAEALLPNKELSNGSLDEIRLQRLRSTYTSLSDDDVHSRTDSEEINMRLGTMFSNQPYFVPDLEDSSLSFNSSQLKSKEIQVVTKFRIKLDYKVYFLQIAYYLFIF